MDRTGLEQWKAREVARLLSLVETERRYYQEMVASLPAGLVVLKADRSILSANRAFRQAVNLRNEELRGRTIEQLFPSNELIEQIRRAHVDDNKDPFFIEVGDRTFRFAIVPSQGWTDEGEPETILMIQDLTTLEARDMGTKAVAPAGLPAIVWRADATPVRFLSVAGAVEELSGYLPAHWIAAPDFFWTRIHPEDLSQVRVTYQTAFDKGGDATAEFRLLKPSGESIWLRETIRVGEPNSARRGISGIATDISRRKQMESQWLAASRVDAMQGLAARLAHDLNNPLMIINGYSEDLLGSFPQQDARRGDVDEILSASRRLSDLSGYLLNFTRRASQAPSKVNLSSSVVALEASLRRDLPQIPVSVHSSGSLSAIAHPEQLHDVLSAIASGAVSLAQKPAGLQISSQMDLIQEHIGSATLTPGPYVRVDFRALGTGPTEAEAMPFETVLPSKDASGSQRAALAKAYAMVRQWGGDITYLGDSQGVLLALYLVAVPMEPPPSMTPAAILPATVVPVETPAPEVLRETILLVDDEAGIRGLVRRILRRERYNVIEAGNGEEALAMAMKHSGSIQLLLTDVMMPGISGTQLAESVRNAFPDVKVVFITGYSETEPTEKSPGALVLQKPFTMTDLLRVVRQALDKAIG